MEQGWIKENPARKIKKVAPEQNETQPFTREQYEALIQATWLYDSREGKKNGDTVNARRARTYLKLLRLERPKGWRRRVSVQGQTAGR